MPAPSGVSLDRASAGTHLSARDVRLWGTKPRTLTLGAMKTAWESLSATGRVFLCLALLGAVGATWQGARGAWGQVVAQALVTALFASLPIRQLVRR